MKQESMSDVEEKDDGGRGRVEREVKVRQAALSKHQRGSWGVGQRKQERGGQESDHYRDSDPELTYESIDEGKERKEKKSKHEKVWVRMSK